MDSQSTEMSIMSQMSGTCGNGVDTGVGDGTEWWSLFSGGYEHKEVFSLVCWVLDYFKVRERKEEGEAAGSDVVSTLDQCSDRLSLNMKLPLIEI